MHIIHSLINILSNRLAVDTFLSSKICEILIFFVILLQTPKNRCFFNIFFVSFSFRTYVINIVHIVHSFFLHTMTHLQVFFLYGMMSVSRITTLP
jgi:hypothetical protein